MLRSRSNCRVIDELARMLVEVIWATPGICENCRSSGVVDRRRHGLRVGAGQAGGDDDGGEIDLGQFGYRQQRKGDDAAQQNRRHHQSCRNRPFDERSRDAHRALLRLSGWTRTAGGRHLHFDTRAGLQPVLPLGHHRVRLP